MVSDGASARGGGEISWRGSRHDQFLIEKKVLRCVCCGIWQFQESDTPAHSRFFGEPAVGEAFVAANA